MPHRTLSAFVALSAALIFLMGGFAEAETVLKMKNGRVITWKSHFEEDGQYCTFKSMGKVCVDKNDVASVESSGMPPKTEAPAIKDKKEPAPVKPSNGEKNKEKNKQAPKKPAAAVEEQAQASCYDKIISSTLIAYPKGKAAACWVNRAQLEDKKTPSFNRFIFFYRATCKDPLGGMHNYLLSCSTSLIDNRWVPQLEVVSQD